MEDELDARLNGILVDTFRNILRVEQNMMRSEGKLILSIGEVHCIEAIGKQEERTITDIARELDITTATACATVDRLERKGYVTRTRSNGDRRMVHLCLTERGKKVDRIHKGFHRNMIRRIMEGFTQDEAKIMLRGVERLDRFFRSAAHKD